jgi:hypothetical protein
MDSDHAPSSNAALQIDVRTAPGFIPRFFPTADGQAVPAYEDKRNADIALEFLSAYYEINLRYARLRDVRAQLQAPDNPRQERGALQAIEQALCHRDELEDRYAPLGVIAEPVAREGFTVDVRFTFGSTDATGRYRSEPFVSSAVLTFQIPKAKGRGDLRPPGAPPCES